MVSDGQSTKWYRNIAENFRRRQTDGRAMTYSKREFMFAKNYSAIRLRKCLMICSAVSTSSTSMTDRQTDRQADNLQTDGRTDKQNASSGITWRRWLAYRWSEPTFWVELGGLIQLQTGSRPGLGLDDWRDSNLSNVPTRGGVCLLWVTHRSIRHAAVKHSAVAVPWPELPCKL